MINSQLFPRFKNQDLTIVPVATINNVYSLTRPCMFPSCEAQHILLFLIPHSIAYHSKHTKSDITPGSYLNWMSLIWTHCIAFWVKIFPIAIACLPRAARQQGRALIMQFLDHDDLKCPSSPLTRSALAHPALRKSEAIRGRTGPYLARLTHDLNLSRAS
jgi:hypothetical protein